jgi:hypothetical protein
VRVTVPVLVPLCVGVNVTEMVQLLPGETGVGQLLVCAKSPLAVMLATGNGAAPLFVNLTFCGGLVLPTCCDPKTRLAGDIRTPVPVPVSTTTSGVAGSSPLMLTLPKRAPEVAGAN